MARQQKAGLAALVVSWVVSGLMLATPLAHAAEPTVLPRAGQWVINYDQNSCQLAGEFGQDKQSVAMVLTWFAPERAPYFQLVGERFRAVLPETKMRVHFPPAGKPVPNTARAARIGKAYGVIFQSDMPHVPSEKSRQPSDSHGPFGDTAAEDGIEGIRIYGVPYGAIELATGKFAKPMAAVRTCLRDLIKSWGYDPDVQIKRKSGPVSKVSVAFLAERLGRQYPAVLDSMGYDGYVQIRTDVSETGTVLGCHPIFRTLTPIDPEAYSRIVCKVMTESETFEPARDADGAPIRSYMIRRIVFE